MKKYTAPFFVLLVAILGVYLVVSKDNKLNSANYEYTVSNNTITVRNTVDGVVKSLSLEETTINGRELFVLGLNLVRKEVYVGLTVTPTPPDAPWSSAQSEIVAINIESGSQHSVLALPGTEYFDSLLVASNGDYISVRYGSGGAECDTRNLSYVIDLIAKKAVTALNPNGLPEDTIVSSIAKSWAGVSITFSYSTTPCSTGITMDELWEYNIDTKEYKQVE
ncbi:MAG TPA: hypothetical protein VI953_01165 [Candidatus Paceibacterota bacterium]